MEDLDLVVEEMGLTHLSDASPSIATPRSMSPELIGGEPDDQTPDTTPDEIPDTTSDVALCKTPDNTDTWLELKPDEDGIETPRKVLIAKLDDAWDKRSVTGRYQRVFVLLIQWENHDFKDDFQESIDKYYKMFTELYNYNVRIFKIPSRKPNLAVAKVLAELAENDASDTLFIIWYDGHGCEHPDRRGSPVWWSHSDPGKAREVNSSIVSTTLGDCEADIFLVNNCCSGLTCDRFSGKGIVESISSSAFNTIEVGSIDPVDPSPCMAWAAHRILSDQKYVDGGITIAELHRQICLATQWTGTTASRVTREDGEEMDDTPQWKYHNVRTQPVYTRLSADAAGPLGRTRSIVLVKLTYETTNPIWWGQKRVELHLRLNDYNDIDPDDWVNWITSAPPCVVKARLQFEEEPGEQEKNSEDDWD
ncbi:hypothetical protein ONZ43_g3023 [Nemania bipapillata]|uniref:Uncharacterized protein n=1 Tax=Nemania bipapillata TaxID=110536 RepID=A0ACC2IYB1_9PEZI|nr:hypothetical protein ONZ43_g3023 [Nemania bipapillata]